MAKKVLTPEEVQAKLQKKAAKRKLFFGTFTKALAFFLAIALAYSLAVIAFTPTTVATTGGTVNGTVSDSTSNTTTSNGGTTSDATDDAATGTNDATAGTSSDAAATGKKDEYVALLNTATTKAASAGYNWTRNAKFTEKLSVVDSNGKDASSTLNKVIALVDDTASIDSVVGGFLDIPKDGAAPYTATVNKGQTSEIEGMRNKEHKFLLKASSITPADVQKCEHEDGSNTYKYYIIACKNPQKDNKNALHRMTNDFVTIDEVRTGVGDALGSFASVLTINDSTVEYVDIVVTAQIENDSLISMNITYTMNVTELNLKAFGSTMVGKGAGAIDIKYDNFVY